MLTFHENVPERVKGKPTHGVNLPSPTNLLAAHSSSAWKQEALLYLRFFAQDKPIFQSQAYYKSSTAIFGWSPNACILG